MRKFDWTTGFDLSPYAYDIDYREDKAEITIPVFNADKKDIGIRPNTRGYKNILEISIPDTRLTKNRTLSFDAGEEYDIRKTKANVRDGMLFLHIPFKEKSKPISIEIT